MPDEPRTKAGGGDPSEAKRIVQPVVYSKNALTYGTYLKVPELLALQIPQSDPAHHDELLFIVIHQAYELWFKLILHELEVAIEQMDGGEILAARHFVNRVVEVLKLLVRQIHILETLEPVEFLQFRNRLMPASGFQSVQFREIEFLIGLRDEKHLRAFKNRPAQQKQLKKRFEARTLRDAYYGMLSRLGFTVPDDVALERVESDSAVRADLVAAVRRIYQRPAENLPLHLLSESLLDLDQSLLLWREHHVHVVERVIGFKHGTGGSSGVSYLRTTLGRQAFPALWEVRTHLEASG